MPTSYPIPLTRPRFRDKAGVRPSNGVAGAAGGGGDGARTRSSSGADADPRRPAVLLPRRSRCPLSWPGTAAALSEGPCAGGWRLVAARPRPGSAANVAPRVAYLRPSLTVRRLPLKQEGTEGSNPVRSAKESVASVLLAFMTGALMRRIGPVSLTAIAMRKFGNPFSADFREDKMTMSLLWLSGP
jgi:hypothetical protein